MPYDDELDLVAGAMGQSVWIWPFQVGIPTLQQITDALFPRPTLFILPHWPGWVLDKWNQFADLFKVRFSQLAGEEIEDEYTFKAIVVESAEWAASEMGFSLWDMEQGLPSMPVYIPAEVPVENPG
jgi:hypothetical protein